MEIFLNCKQIESLINLYINDKLDPYLKIAIENHISKCSKCKKKIEQLQNVLFQYRKSEENKTKKDNDIELVKNLSAYIDNELETTENVKIKKITILNPDARKKLESMYNYQKLLHSAYERTKSNIKFDYSKNIISVLNDSYNYTTNYFRNIMIMFLIIIIAIICGFVYLYF